MKIHFDLNGQEVEVEASASTTLLTLLRETLGLTGAKPACEVGECGACSVIVDGRVVDSCLMLAAQVDGRRVVTVEGLVAAQDGPNDLQQAFLDAGAVQCGYCTPGFIVAAEALLARNSNPNRQEIRQGIAGNLCRCTGYHQIVDAVEMTAARRRGYKSQGNRGGHAKDALA